jgi:hypothetical protein
MFLSFESRALGNGGRRVRFEIRTIVEKLEIGETDELLPDSGAINLLDLDGTDGRTILLEDGGQS